uniref:Uroporphyrinogen decarboxylase n=1 Tax=Chloropicon laureae TaxID=464258 RepID=A0A7S3E2X8_9CHLO|mmetsp:Transcript_4600/g.11628  ORF Transcript_4600/g.11628 Transcript_4600/m.11628 type:complete len:397 (+) Transcript_4600:179-1369(+)
MMQCQQHLGARRGVSSRVGATQRATLSSKRATRVQSTVETKNNKANVSSVATEEPLLLRAVRGENVERPPVWMMRQAGRYMKSYQDLCKKYPTFRERSEIPELSIEISLQPWKVFRPDGVILFSDILTPLEGMNINFDFIQGKGPVIEDPIRTMAQVEKVCKLDPALAVPFVGQTLEALSKEIGNESTLLGFCGAPYTLASYIVEGGSSKNYTNIKKLAFNQPEVLHALLAKLADGMIDYLCYQAESGAQTVQIFDSWASHLSPVDFEVFSLPYIKQIVSGVKARQPDLPIILYISGGAGILERMADTGVDIVSLDTSLDITDARRRIDDKCGIQGNIDPCLILAGNKEAITKRVHDTIEQGKGTKHILNLGHGVLPGTSEENVGHFFDTAKNFRW